MKIKTLWTFIFIFSFSCSPCVAAPSYGTKMPSKNQFYFGGQTYSVQQRELEGDHGEMSSLQHFMLVSYGITDWFSLDFKGGAGNTHQTPEGGDQINYPAFMAGGYGFRVKAYDKNKTKVVFGFQHISVHPYSIFIDNVKHKAVIDDWQLSFLVSRNLKRLTPYMGTRWSRMDYIHWTEDDRNRVKSDPDQTIGMIVGMDIPVHEKIWINVEGQFFDAEAVSASINFHF